MVPQRILPTLCSGLMMSIHRSFMSPPMTSGFHSTMNLLRFRIHFRGLSSRPLLLSTTTMSLTNTSKLSLRRTELSTSDCLTMKLPTSMGRTPLSIKQLFTTTSPLLTITSPLSTTTSPLSTTTTSPLSKTTSPLSTTTSPLSTTTTSPLSTTTSPLSATTTTTPLSITTTFCQLSHRHTAIRLYATSSSATSSTENSAKSTPNSPKNPQTSSSLTNSAKNPQNFTSYNDEKIAQPTVNNPLPLQEQPNSAPDGEAERYLTIPNALCVSRMVLSPVLAYMVIQGNYDLALKMFVFAGATDLLDGFIARHVPGQSSNVGTALDPLADKCLVAALFFSLTAAHQIPLWLAALVVSRDVVLIIYSMSIRWRLLDPPRTWARYWDPSVSTIAVKPTTISKYNTGLQLLTSASALLAAATGYSYHPALQALWAVTACTTVASGLSYAISKDTVAYLKTKRRL